ncbi:Phosphoglucomutase, cytoplasmic [Dendrobium catenatum]|uniref:Phosphoglucomutase, cytoplasmic n=1 Tax=Dendrobium catenatum TaxID=906689 RepID=A0A2I0WXS8_9ASPA|nr:Phosphoglucomutase, cytoplasmic [Dendrobium catenatum]
MTPSRKPTPDRRRPTTAAARSTAASTDHSEYSKNDLISTVQLLRQSMSLDSGSGRVLFDSAELSASSDTDGVSSGSNSGAHELNVHRHAPVTSRGISVSARFWQETNGRLHRQPKPGNPVSSIGSMNPTIPHGDNPIRHLVQKILDSGWTEIPMALAYQIAKRNDQHLMAAELYENYNVGIWNDDTAGVEMPSLNAAEKVDSVQCIQTVRRNDVKGFNPNLKRLEEVVQKLIGPKGNYDVEVFDSASDYVELMKSLFDFESI